MLLFEVREKSIRGAHSEQFTCSVCGSNSSRLVSSLQSLSFSFFSLFPFRVKYSSECTCCKRTTYHPKSSAFPEFGRSDKIDSLFGSFTLIGLIFLAFSYISFVQNYQAQVRVSPQVGDILFVDTGITAANDNGLQLPYRMAKVVKIEPELDAVAISYSTYTYDSNNSMNRDFVGKSYLFDSYFKQKVELVPVTKLEDKNLFFDTKRSLRDANIELIKPLIELNQDVKQQLQQTNELTRLFKLFS